MSKVKYVIVEWPDGKYGVRKYMKTLFWSIYEYYVDKELNEWSDPVLVQRHCKMTYTEADMIRRKIRLQDLSAKECIEGAKVIKYQGEMMNNLTTCDWEIILAAYSYEVLDGLPTMSDAYYDRLCQSASRRGCKIPGFSDYTGTWVRELDQELLDKVLKSALKYNKSRADLHHPGIKQALNEHNISYCCCLD